MRRAIIPGKRSCCSCCGGGVDDPAPSPLYSGSVAVCCPSVSSSSHTPGCWVDRGCTAGCTLPPPGNCHWARWQLESSVQPGSFKSINPNEHYSDMTWKGLATFPPHITSLFLTQLNSALPLQAFHTCNADCADFAALKRPCTGLSLWRGG